MTRDRTWRPNCGIHEIPPDPARDFAGATVEGVDLNRNYPTRNWGQGEPDDFAAGPSPGSEPETRAVARLIREHRFRASISYHNYGMALFYFHHAGYVRHVAAAMGTLLNQVVGNEQAALPPGPAGTPAQLARYEVSDGSVAVPSTGNIADYCYEHAPGQPTLGLELPPKWDGGHSHRGYTWVAEDTLDQAFRENLPAALALINSAGFAQPPAEVRVCVDPGAHVVQVVDDYAKAFDGWKLEPPKPEE
jgi:hypothetical protein